MTAAGSAPAEPEEPVGAILAKMRHARGLTGADLADMVNMSQPKISRIERGRASADPEDVRAIARALGADESLIQTLIRRAEQSQDRMTDWRPVPTDLASRQDRVRDWEISAREVRDFQPAVLTGLLQTSGYARATLASFHRVASPAPGKLVETSILAAVSARVRRQEALADPDRSFRFVFLEAVLRNPLCPPAEMIAQVNRIREVSARYTNVTIGVVPDGTALAIPPLHGFTLFDEALILIDAYNTGLTTRGRTDIKQYRQVFEEFQAHATTDVEPILARYEKLYLDQLNELSGR